jgi:uncharacterized protein YkwD
MRAAPSPSGTPPFAAARALCRGILTVGLLASTLFNARSSYAQTGTPAPSAAPGTDPQAIGDSPARPPDPRSIDAQPAEVQSIFKLTNSFRVTQGRAPLSWSPELAAAARAHAQLVATKTTGELLHRYPGEAELTARAKQAGAHFSGIAENIAQGDSVQQIEQEWLNSAPHRASILDRGTDALGVGVVILKGTLYAVEDFAALSVALTPEGVEEKVQAELFALGVHPAILTTAEGSPEKLKEDVREDCRLATGLADNTVAGFIIRWEGPTLALPQALADAVISHEFGTAVVGACAPIGEDNPGFTTYRVAVLLF